MSFEVTLMPSGRASRSNNCSTETPLLNLRVDKALPQNATRAAA
jgi:hypothetical protein